MSQIFHITKFFKITQGVFDTLKGSDLVLLTCSICSTEYQKTKKNVLQHNKRQANANLFCSSKCLGVFKTTKNTVNTMCITCKEKITKKKNQFEKSSNHFCSRSCSTIFNNKNKSYGTRRSKLEEYLEKCLKETFPNLTIVYSGKEVIGSELDIYIPSLKLAFEIQGIFHYEPIFGQEKLDQIQKNDLLKVMKCREKDIELISINCSKQKNVTTETNQPFLKLIISIIDNSLSGIGVSNPSH